MLPTRYGGFVQSTRLVSRHSDEELRVTGGEFGSVRCELWGRTSFGFEPLERRLVARVIDHAHWNETGVEPPNLLCGRPGRDVLAGLDAVESRDVDAEMFGDATGRKA